MRRWAAWLLILLITACTSGPKRESGSEPGSPAPALAITKEVPSLALVLGPGGAKTFSEAGVLKALQEHHIPIARIVGIEWGALIASAFAAHGKFHEVDWKLYRLDQIDLSGNGGFLGFGRERSIKMLAGYFRDNFGTLDFSSLKIPFSCPARSYWSATVVWQQKGLVADALSKCMPFPPVLQVHSGWLAASTQVRDAIETLKGEGYKLVVFVNVLGTAPPFGSESRNKRRLTCYYGRTCDDLFSRRRVSRMRSFVSPPTRFQSIDSINVRNCKGSARKKVPKRHNV